MKKNVQVLSYCCCCYCLDYFNLTGNVNLNSAPFPSKLFTPHILPPCASIIFLQIYSPKPVPVVESEVANFVNNLDNILSDIPSPVSFTLTITSSSSSFTFLIFIYTNKYHLLVLSSKF